MNFLFLIVKFLFYFIVLGRHAPLFSWPRFWVVRLFLGVFLFFLFWSSSFLWVSPQTWWLDWDLPVFPSFASKSVLGFVKKEIKHFFLRNTSLVLVLLLTSFIIPIIKSADYCRFLSEKRWKITSSIQIQIQQFKFSLSINIFWTNWSLVSLLSVKNSEKMSIPTS